MVGTPCRRPGSKRVALIYPCTEDPGIQISLFCLIFVAFKFEELNPIVNDTEEKIEKFIAHSITDRSLKFDLSSLQEGSSTTASMAIGKNSYFAYKYFELIRILN